MPCDPVGQVSSDLVCQLFRNEAKKARETIMHESLHKNPQRSSNKAYARSCKELCHQITARDVMDAAAGSSKVTLIP